MSSPANKVCVKVPASTANLGPGFDSLGMALNLYAWIEMSLSERTEIILHGEELSNIPKDKSNLIYKVANQMFELAGKPSPDLRIVMYSDIPLTRGLGSSASAIVGGMAAANALMGHPLSMDDMFQAATALEQHPDNVGASLFGGIVVAFWDGKRAEYIRIEPHADLEVVVAIPDFKLATEKARNVLPKKVTMNDAVYNIGHSSLLVAALCSGRMEMIKHAMKDALHQPYRAAMIPGMEQVLQGAAEHGALGAALSGAGPTLFTLVDKNSDQKKTLEKYLLDTLQTYHVNAEAIWLKPCLTGIAEVLSYNTKLNLIENIKGEAHE